MHTRLVGICDYKIRIHNMYILLSNIPPELQSPHILPHEAYQIYLRSTRYDQNMASSILDRISEVVLYLAGRLTSTVPFNLAVSGAPSPFVLFSGLPAMSVECLVSVFERPSCLPLWVDASPDFLDAAASDKVSRTDDKSRVITYLVFRCV